MAKSATPFLMFQGGTAQAALDLYANVLGARVVDIERWPEGGPATPGTIMLARFEVFGQAILVSDSPVKHPFDFTPSSSLFVECESREELERLFAALGEGGRVLMPPDDYGFSARFCWVDDRFGVSWQLNLARPS